MDINTALSVGSELNARVAVAVMGLPEIQWSDQAHCPNCGERCRYFGCSSCGEWYYSPYKDYGGNILDAMEVVEKLRKCGWCIDITGEENWRVEFDWHHGDVLKVENAEAESLPEAICRAALAAVAKGENNGR